MVENKLTNTLGDTVLDKPPAYTPTGFDQSENCYPKIAKLFKVLKDNEIAKLIKDNIKKDIVYLGEFFEEEGVSKCKVTVYECNDSTTMVDTGRDWCYHKYLWFEFNTISKGYESFISFLADYRTVFSVDSKQPLVSFTVTI